VNRRTFLTTTGLAAVGYGLSGCASNARPNATPGRSVAARPQFRLAPVQASWDGG